LIINDDLAALSSIPSNMGRAAARKVGDLAYNILISNPTMNQDGTALFDATHNNIAATAGAPSVAIVDEMRTAMALQTDPSGATLNMNLDRLIVPKALVGVASTLRNAQFDPDTAETSGNVAGNRPNWVAGTFEVISDPRLDQDSAVKWYAAGSPADLVEVTFLNGNSAPMMEQQSGFTVDGTTYKVRLDATATPLDFRGLAYNAGA
jgi:hypothetical protein